MTAMGGYQQGPFSAMGQGRPHAARAGETLDENFRTGRAGLGGFGTGAGNGISWAEISQLFPVVPHTAAGEGKLH